MRRKVRNWTAFLLALALVLGMIPAAYAAGYSITVNAPTGNDLPYCTLKNAIRPYPATGSHQQMSLRKKEDSDAENAP